MTCPECKGRGEIVLFTSREPCGVCSNRAPEAPAVFAHAMAERVRKGRALDREGALRAPQPVVEEPDHFRGGPPWAPLATGVNLDRLAARRNLTRRPGELDHHFRVRISTFDRVRDRVLHYGSPPPRDQLPARIQGVCVPGPDTDTVPVVKTGRIDSMGYYHAVSLLDEPGPHPQCRCVLTSESDK